jgi:hypothetical protein
MSFKRYIEKLTKRNENRAQAKGPQVSAWKIWRDVMGAAATSMFFVHWVGRIARSHGGRREIREDGSGLVTD